MKMMRITVKKTIKIFLFSELIIVLSYFISFSFFINLQIAFLSSYFVILGSSIAYKKMVENQILSNMIEEQRDLLDEIEDPHGLYDNEVINETPVEELDLKAIVKEEKSKIKTFSVDSMKHGVRGSASAYRLIPYAFLVLGFIALKNNEILDIAIYLPSLLVGIVAGSLSSKEKLS